jgi:ABC-2 type transport system ATP-binding protein
VFLARLHGIGRADAARRATELLGHFDLEDRAGDVLDTLSLGNQQRVQIAASLIHHPDALVLDEPFSGLDPVAVDAMAGLLAKEGGDKPLLFSSHQLDLVERLCDRVAIIQHGRLVALGTIDELRGKGPLQIWVDAPAASRDWASGLPGARVMKTDGTRVLLELDSSTDDQQVLKAALATGPVREFRRNVPSLLDIFRHAMTEVPDAATA